MMEGQLTLPVRSSALRWGVAVGLAAVALVAAYASARWAVAGTILYAAERSPVPSSALVRAHDLDPSNPKASYLLGIYYLDAAQPPDLDAAATYLDAAVALAPNRDVYWLAVGRKRELSGDVPGAVEAFERARALAPNQWRAAWMLGNLYVRQGDLKRAVGELTIVSSANPEMTPLAIRTVWMASDGDLKLTRDVAGDTADGRIALMSFFLGRKDFDGAVAMWREVVREYPDVARSAWQGKQLSDVLLEAGRGREAVEVLGAIAPDSVPGEGVVANGGFESPISAKKAESPFEWTIRQVDGARVSLGQGRTSQRALQIDYESGSVGAIVHATEMARVEPGASYVLSAWVATDDLRSGGPPAIAVSDVASGAKVLANQVLPVGTEPWQQIRLSFVAPESGLISIGVGRAPCGPVCPIFGSVRVDDISLEH